MKILYMKYPAIGGETIKKYFIRLGCELKEFDFPHNSAEIRNGEELGMKIANAILQENVDVVFSFNFFPVVATAVHVCRKKYISWIYDCPTSLLFSMSVFFPENYIFHFDSSQVERMRKDGIEHAFYLPLASNYEEYDSMIPDEETIQKYKADIAMIGSMYRNKYWMFKKYEHYNDYIRGYLDALVKAQEELYGVDILENALTPDIMKEIMKFVPLSQDKGDAYDTPQWNFANYYLSARVTANERERYLKALSRKYDVAVYTADSTEHIENVRNMGVAEYYNEAPYVMKSAKINLNITLHSIHTGIPLRVMDVMGCGGFLMSNYQADLCYEFEAGKDFVLFENIEDAVEKAGYYLMHEEERRRIARNGYMKVKKKHGFMKKCQILLQTSGF